MTIKAILFDFDGVIVESVNVKTEAFRELFSNEADYLPAIINFHLTNGGMSRFTKFELIYRDILHRPLSSYESEELSHRFAKLVKEKVMVCPYVPGALEFIQKYAKTIPLFIASATPHDELIEIISHRNLKPLFREIRGAPFQKDEIIQAILKKYELLTHEIPFIGDAINDYSASVRAGLPFYGRVPSGSQNPFPDDVPIFPDLIDLERYLF